MVNIRCPFGEDRDEARSWRLNELVLYDLLAKEGLGGQNWCGDKNFSRITEDDHDFRGNLKSLMRNIKEDDRTH